MLWAIMIDGYNDWKSKTITGLVTVLYSVTNSLGGSRLRAMHCAGGWLDKRSGVDDASRNPLE